MTTDAGFQPPPNWTQQDIDRFVGLSYRTLLVRAAAGEITDIATALADLDRLYMNGSITWPMPTLAIRSDDEWLTAEEIGRECGVPPETVRVWAQRGKFTRVRKPGQLTRYRWGDVKAYRARIRQLLADRNNT
ncbi:helix-turn-helix domain-containing protein [Mycolicibacterium canariasense]|uniref:helix-turn-helix domain-containing protein n=1 Tax=Mycolicibacterium canariasense TaxID=228230 RepID=UPI00105477DA|nr:helix-turn-helix domain-containing protein [Mycolicibacterium canariasense]MCV7208379.1 helix-turn-helix domain-containing protein [Mycolicibacterium canariasense]